MGVIPPRVPIDTATGLQAGEAVHVGASDHTERPLEMVDVLVGYLATHADGFEARVGPDRARAEHYAAKQRATLEPMFVRRAAREYPG